MTSSTATDARAGAIGRLERLMEEAEDDNIALGAAAAILHATQHAANEKVNREPR